MTPDQKYSLTFPPSSAGTAARHHLLHCRYTGPRCHVSGAEWGAVRLHGEIAAHGVPTDSTGMARVMYKRAGGPDVDVREEER